MHQFYTDSQLAVLNVLARAKLSDFFSGEEAFYTNTRNRRRAHFYILKQTLKFKPSCKHNDRQCECSWKLRGFWFGVFLRDVPCVPFGNKILYRHHVLRCFFDVSSKSQHLFYFFNFFQESQIKHTLKNNMHQSRTQMNKINPWDTRKKLVCAI